MFQIKNFFETNSKNAIETFTKIELPNRICTLCNDKDIQAEYYGGKMCPFPYSGDTM